MHWEKHQSTTIVMRTLALTPEDPRKMLTCDLRERLLASGRTTASEVAGMRRGMLLKLIGAAEDTPTAAGMNPLTEASRFPYPRFATTSVPVTPPPQPVVISGPNYLGASTPPPAATSPVPAVPLPANTANAASPVSTTQPQLERDERAPADFPPRSTSITSGPVSATEVAPPTTEAAVIFATVAIAPQPPSPDVFLRARAAHTMEAANANPGSPKNLNEDDAADPVAKLPHEMLLDTEKGKALIDYNPWTASSAAKPFLTNRFLHQQRMQSIRPGSLAAILDQLPQVLQQNVEAAEIGDSDSMYLIGKSYLEGTGGLDKNVGWALTWLNEAAIRDHPDALLLLGKMYSDSTVRKWEVKRRIIRVGKNEDESYHFDLALAADFYLRAAEQGDLEAMFKLGKAYENGAGVPKSERNAYEWYYASAVKGFARAQNIIGWCYWKGFGVPKDMVEACRWYRRAAEQGLVEGQANLGLAYSYGWAGVKDPVEAAHWFWAAAVTGGDSKSAYELAALIEKGKGLQADLGKAFGWYMCAAEAGYSKAMEKLARMFLDGLFCPVDKSEAARWYHRAIDAGSTNAMLVLGQMYAKGDGVVLDHQMAFNLFSQAAERGDAKAKLLVAEYLETGKGTKRDLPRAIKLYSELIQDSPSGAHEAYYHLGTCYEFGKGVPQDMTKAFNYYQIAYQVHGPAATALGRIFQVGISPLVQRNTEKAILLFEHAANRGDHVAMYHLGATYLTWGQSSISEKSAMDIQKATGFFRRAVQANYAPAMQRLGALYLSDPKDQHQIEEGVYLVSAAADMGDAEAMDLLAKLYTRGVDVDANGSLIKPSESVGRLSIFKSSSENSVNGSSGGSRFNLGKFRIGGGNNSNGNSQQQLTSDTASVSTSFDGAQNILVRDANLSSQWKAKAAAKRREKENLDQAILKAAKKRVPVEDIYVDAIDKFKIGV
ncbi:hypothetical protein BC830DRAFT_1087561 [Chytriomyces sp. MP71]|nr:hypothetical protein BC830DRAFT_1087561 [Chytriomyces sp. MP71]